MNEMNCEKISLAAMVMLDGGEALLSRSEIEDHLAICSNCRDEVEHLTQVCSLLNAQQRKQQTDTVWPAVRRKLSDARSERAMSASTRLFFFLGFVLVGHKLLGVISQHDFGVWFKLFPLLLVIAAFSVVKQNPFKINAQLGLEGTRNG